MELIRDIDTNLPRRLIVESVVRLCEKLGIVVIAQGIETTGEYHTLCELGVRYFQGYLLARLGFRTLPAITMPDKGYSALADQRRRA
jgi:EAL domain-containing protein (putative c-di-GMP-specific phosphodiesterase class I)